jgi:hypothetical protein
MIIVRITIDENVYKEYGPFKHGADAAAAVAEFRNALRLMTQHTPQLQHLTVTIECDELPIEPYREPSAQNEFCLELRAQARTK